MPRGREYATVTGNMNMGGEAGQATPGVAAGATTLRRVTEPAAAGSDATPTWLLGGHQRQTLVASSLWLKRGYARPPEHDSPPQNKNMENP